jgi:predicted NAD/FAD-binding protein
VFLNVMRDSLGARRAASDMLIPRTDLTALFPQQAAAFVQQHGGSIQCGAAVKSVLRNDDGWQLDVATPGASATGDERFDAVVVATQPAQAAALVDGLADVRSLTSLRYEPITTCYLQYEPAFKLEQVFFALVDDPAHGDWGQFVFDRGQLEASHEGLLAVVVSGSSDAIESGHHALAAAIADQLARVFRQPRLAVPKWTKVISEKRATFSCAPALIRPGNATGVKGLVIAGDYTAGDYPATLESAIRSGVDAARCITRLSRRSQ